MWRKHTGMYISSSAKYALERDPEEIAQVEQIWKDHRDQHGLVWKKGQTKLTETQTQFCRMLFQRALKDIPWIDQFNKDIRGHHNAFVNNCLPAESWEEI